MTERTGYTGWSIMLAALTGAAAGAAVAYLTTTKTGAARRKELNGYLETGREKVEEYVTTGRDKVRAFPEAVKSASSAAREAFTETLRTS